MAVQFLKVRSTPFQLGNDQLCNFSMQINSATEFRQIESERRVNSALAFSTMAPSVTRTVKTSTIYDHSVSGSANESGSSWLCTVVGNIIAELDVSKANLLQGRSHRTGSGGFVRNLLSFYSDLHGNVLSQKVYFTDFINVQRTFVLSEQAIAALIKFAVEFEHMNENTWLYVFRILIAIDVPPEGREGREKGQEIKSYKFTNWVENSPSFKPFLKKFLTSSFGRLSAVSSTVSLKIYLFCISLQQLIFH